MSTKKSPNKSTNKRWFSKKRVLIAFGAVWLVVLGACALVAVSAGLLFPAPTPPVPTAAVLLVTTPEAGGAVDPAAAAPPDVLVVADPEGAQDEPTPVGAVSPNATPKLATTPAAASTVQPNSTPDPADPVMSNLLLGYGGPSHPGGYLTDTIILAVYSPTKKGVVLFSIPRDIWVTYSYTSGGQTKQISHKLNTAYANGGGKLTREVVSSLIGYKIQSYAAVDFDTFSQAVDEVGGIDVEVAESFADFRSGKQHFDGERALMYARVREAPDNPSESSDFARSRRQRQVVQSFVAKLRTPSGLLHLVPLLGIARQGLRTDRALPSIGDLTTLVRDSGSLSFYEASLTTDNYLRSTTGPDGMYILLPSARSGRWDQVRGFVAALLANPSVGKLMASREVTVKNGTGGATNASLQDYVEAKGYRVSAVVDAAQQATTRIVGAEQDAPLAESLKVSLQREGISPSVDLSGNGGLTVTLGRDWRDRK